MTKLEYLKLRAFDSADWDVIDSEAAGKLLEKTGAINNMYPVKEREATKAFGKGAYIVRIAWMKKHQGEDSETVEQEAPVSKTPPPPPSKTPPPPPPKKEEPKAEEETESSDDMPAYLKVRIGRIIALGYEPKGEHAYIGKDGHYITVKELGAMPNDEYTKTFVIPKKEEEKEETKLESKGNPFYCNMFDNTGDSCDVQCDYCLSLVEKQASEVPEVQEKEAEIPSHIKNRIEALEKMGYEFNNQFGCYAKMVGSAVLDISLEDVNNMDPVVFKGALDKLSAEEKELLTDKSIEEKVDEVVDSGMTTNVTAENVSEIEVEEEVVEEKTALEQKWESEEQSDAVVEQKEEVVEQKVQEPISDRESKKEKVQTNITVPSSAGGFFSTLQAIGFQQLNLTINLVNANKLNVIVKPENFSGDAAYDKIKPMTLNGTADELDKGFFETIVPPLQEVHGLMSDAKSFIEEAKKLKAKTEAEKKKKDEIKKLVDDAKKYHDKEGFDAKKISSYNTARKKWMAVTEKDPNNKTAAEALKKLDEQAGKQKLI